MHESIMFDSGIKFDGANGFIWDLDLPDGELADAGADTDAGDRHVWLENEY
jgi:hypothetical protein